MCVCVAEGGGGKGGVGGGGSGAEVTTPFPRCCDSCLKSTTARELPENSCTA